MKSSGGRSSEKQWRRPLGAALTALMVTALLAFILLTRSPPGSDDNIPFLLRTTSSLLTSSPSILSKSSTTNDSTIHQLETIVHYGTSKVVPQQTREEIEVSFAVLRRRLVVGCNFLVFGLGYDSQMWAALNAGPGGRTLFLEESPTWVQHVLSQAPYLNAYAVQYRTRLDQAWRLLKEYKQEPDCWPPARAYLRGNTRCTLALHNLPEEVYQTDWDLIMIDAPRGYFPSAPGRMAAIYSAAVMARNRRRNGNGNPTHVFLHDVDRPVERHYANEFLCNKYLVASVGRLWHFQIPQSGSGPQSNDDTFC